MVAGDQRRRETEPTETLQRSDVNESDRVAVLREEKGGLRKKNVKADDVGRAELRDSVARRDEDLLRGVWIHSLS